MSEHLPELDPLRTTPVAGGPGADLVRRRGDTRRRRIRAAAVAGTAAAVLAVVGGTWALTGGDPGRPRPMDPATQTPTQDPSREPSQNTSQGPSPTASPSDDDAVAARPLTENALLEPGTIPTDGLSSPVGLKGWAVRPDRSALACQPEGSAADLLDAEGSVRRTFGMRPDLPAATVDYAVFSEEVLRFDDDSAAVQAMSTAQEWIRTCPGPAEDEQATDEGPAAPAMTETVFDRIDARGWSFASPDICTNCDALRLTRQVVVQYDDRLLLWSIQVGNSPSPERALDRAMNAIAPVVASTAWEPAPATSDFSPSDDPLAQFWSPDPMVTEQVPQGEVPDLPLTDGLADFTGDGGEIEGPEAGLAGVDRALICGEPIVAAQNDGREAGFTGRLVSTSSGPEYHEVHQVVSYAGVEDALGQMAYLRDLVASCPEQSPPAGVDLGWTTMTWTSVAADTGYDSFTFGQSYDMGTGATSYQFTRVGRAILVVSISGEFGPAPMDADDAVRLTQDTRALAGGLCVFTADGC